MPVVVLPLSVDAARDGIRGGLEVATKLSRRRATCRSRRVAYREARCISSSVPRRVKFSLDAHTVGLYLLARRARMAPSRISSDDCSLWVREPKLRPLMRYMDEVVMRRNILTGE
jgi:hypothetical protein